MRDTLFLTFGVPSVLSVPAPSTFNAAPCCQVLAYTIHPVTRREMHTYHLVPPYTVTGTCSTLPRHRLVLSASQYQRLCFTHGETEVWYSRLDHNLHSTISFLLLKNHKISMKNIIFCSLINKAPNWTTTLPFPPTWNLWPWSSLNQFCYCPSHFLKLATVSEISCSFLFVCSNLA